MTDANGNIIALPIQGNGHIECADGTRCAIYIDNKGNQYARAEKEVCDHSWKRIEYGHDKEMFRCTKCGKEDWS